MKLLFDQNISFRIVKKIEIVFPNAQQVRRLRLENSSDSDIWEYAQKNDFTIVTFDSDFLDIATFRGFPPKIIWIRTGNMTTNYIAQILFEKQEIIKNFIHDKEYENIACLELN